MPTYEYLCKNCGYRFEKFQSINDEPVRECPKCKQIKVERLLNGGSGLIFKGSGFYITDYKKSQNSESNTQKNKEAKNEKATTNKTE
ncbi:MAG: FmdB family zinc ribbon protein [candidate division KSB1 bacterium]|nr:FmdB family zinc ribbon protein [candidate division KSB1 bacterium]